jgi:hypothetical protein
MRTLASLTFISLDGFYEGANGELDWPNVDSTASEFQRQTRNDEGGQKEGQEPLSGASVGDGLALGGVEGFSAARLSAIADLQAMTSRLDWCLERAVHFDRADRLPVDHDVVRVTTDLRSDCLVRYLQRCRHLSISSRLPIGRCPGAGRRTQPTAAVTHANRLPSLSPSHIEGRHRLGQWGRLSIEVAVSGPAPR